MVDGTIHKNEKLIDHFMAELRGNLLKEYLKDYTVEQLLQNDRSREDLLPFLKIQQCFQNARHSSPLSYAVVDGFPINTEQIKIVDVHGASEITLASDGYPVLKGTLKESEQELASILNQDPLCKDLNPSTKGLQKNNRSFDDRSYIRMQINNQ
ncbi:hypothetical protein [Oceanobacillus salinisoli]|uniref:hypothetical protein n=1 Tax=Oceanobacillus salinisoli TaxID=2678611 RepID=UPI0012E1A8D8|nr:hypothetical protein [Oceanobacillus salinisoli]